MAILVFVLGMIIGSFLNVCIYRIPRNESVVYPGSRCPNCGNRLVWFELFPVISFLLIKGRCRNCSISVSGRYPFIEMLTGFLFYGAYYFYGIGVEFLSFSVLASYLVVVSLIDLDFRIIPNKLVLFGLVTGIAAGILRPGAGIKFLALGLLAGFGLMFLVALLSGGRMGYGDVKLSAVLGVFLGWKAVLLAVFFAFVGGAVFGLFLMAFLGKSRKTAVPFGPFLAMGALVSYLWSGQIISWYLNMIY